MITLTKIGTPAGRGNCYGDRHFTERPIPEQIDTCQGCPCLRDCRAFGKRQPGADGLVFGGVEIRGRASRKATPTERTLRCQWCGVEFTVIGGGRRAYCPEHANLGTRKGAA